MMNLIRDLDKINKHLASLNHANANISLYIGQDSGYVTCNELRRELIDILSKRRLVLLTNLQSKVAEELK